jgi:hypothetical protein
LRLIILDGIENSTGYTWAPETFFGSPNVGEVVAIG